MTVEVKTAPSVHEAVRRVIADLGGIGKNQRNKEQGYNFRGIDDVLKELHPLLAEHGVVIAPDVEERIYEERVSAKGTVGHCAHLHVRYRVYGPTGDSIELSSWGEGLDYGDKATNKAMTAAFKYMLFELFAVADPADDADHETPESGATSRSSADWQPVEPRPVQSGASSWPARHEKDGKPPPGPSCPSEGCTGTLRERTTKNGDPFLVCSSGKNGCGLPPMWDTSLEGYVAVKGVFDNAADDPGDDPAEDLGASIPFDQGASPQRTPTALEAVLADVSLRPPSEVPALTGVPANCAEIRRLIEGMDNTLIRDVFTGVPGAALIISNPTGNKWKLSAGKLADAGEAVQIELIAALAKLKA